MTPDPTVRQWVREDRVTWEIGPLQEIVDHRPATVGYELRLFAQHDADVHPLALEQAVPLHGLEFPAHRTELQHTDADHRPVGRERHRARGAGQHHDADQAGQEVRHEVSSIVVRDPGTDTRLLYPSPSRFHASTRQCSTAGLLDRLQPACCTDDCSVWEQFCSGTQQQAARKARPTGARTAVGRSSTSARILHGCAQAASAAAIPGS